MSDEVHISKEQFEREFRRHYRTLCFFAERLVKDKQVAEDIVQDTFLKLYSRAAYQGEEQTKAYLYITTKNAAFNHGRHLDIVRRSWPEIPTDTFNPEILKHMIHAEFMRLVWELVEQMPGEKMKTVFKLCWQDGLKNHEISAVMQSSTNTVKEQKAKGMNWLRSKIFEIFGSNNGRNILNGL